MASIAIDTDKVVAHLRQRHTQQLDDATFEIAQLRAAVDSLQAENDRLTARCEELGHEVARLTDG